MRTAWAGLLLCVVGCGGTGVVEPDAGLPDDAATASPDARLEPPLVWTPCGSRECSELSVPVRWSAPQGARLALHVEHLPRIAPKAQLWLLQGGPGAAGAGLGALLDTIATRSPELELFLPDHRGSGLSGRLACDDEEAPQSPGGVTITDEEWPVCVASLRRRMGDTLADYSSEAAARDLAALIARFRVSGRPVFIYGVGYGTTLAHRFLQLSPDGADGVILDSVSWPDRTYLDYDSLWNQAARGWFDLCGADALCSSKLGADPWSALDSLERRLADGSHCPAVVDAGLTPRRLEQLLAALIAHDDTRVAAPALVYRLQRCAPADRDAAMNALRWQEAQQGADTSFSPVLARNILLSELGLTDPAMDPVLERAAEACLACPGIGIGLRARTEAWPRYPFPERLRSWAATETPLLQLAGGLDPLAPAARLMASGAAEHFTAQGQSIIIFPHAAQSVVDSTPTRTPGAPDCGLDLLLQFVVAPRAPLDRGCLGDLAPPDFTGTSLAPAILGTPDAWDN